MNRTLKPLDIAAQEAKVYLREARTNPLLRAIPIPLDTIHRALGGLRLGELTFVGGYEGMGKSALVEQLAFSLAESFLEDEGQMRGVFYASMEMRTRQLVNRAIVQRFGVNPFKVNNPDRLSEEELSIYETYYDEVSNLPVIFDDQPGNSIPDIRKQLERMKQDLIPRIVVIDYLQLLQNTDDVAGLDNTSQALKDIAGDYNCHVICISSLNRSDSNVPSNKNLRGSGGIAYNSDNTCFVHRPYVSDPYSNHLWSDYSIFRVGKAREGIVGDHYLLWNGDKVSFTDLTVAQQREVQSLVQQMKMNRNFSSF